jgi:hypothetical protein
VSLTAFPNLFAPVRAWRQSAWRLSLRTASFVIAAGLHRARPPRPRCRLYRAGRPGVERPCQVIDAGTERSIAGGAFTAQPVRRTSTMTLDQSLAASISSERNQDCAGSLVARRCQAIETGTERSIASGMISISAIAAIC